MLKVSEITFVLDSQRAQTKKKYCITPNLTDRIFVLDEVDNDENFEPVGFAQIGYEKGIVLRRLYTDDDKPQIYREFLARVMVNSLMDCLGEVRVLFYDELLLQFGFKGEGNEMRANCSELILESECKGHGNRE